MERVKTDLTSGDLARLAACGISRELAEQAGLRRVDSNEGAALVGRRPGSGVYSGVDFPYRLPGADGVHAHRLRRDRPPIEFDAEQEPREREKYLSAPGQGNRPYFVAGTAAEWLKNAELPVILVEGEKKCLALWQLAHHGLGDAAERPRFLPIGVGFGAGRGKR